MMPLANRAAYGWLFVLGAAAVMPSAATAQPLFATVDTLEWMVVDSDVIVRATITDGRREPDGPHAVWETVTAKVDETLKGTHRPEVKFVIRPYPASKEPARWKEQKRSVLLFLVDSKGAEKRDPKYAEQDLALRPTHTWRLSCIALDKDAQAIILTRDVRAPTDPEVVLELTRAAIAAMAKTEPRGSHVLHWTGAVPRHSMWWGYHRLSLRVPVDGRDSGETDR